jgi:chromosomal replication initiator protein
MIEKFEQLTLADYQKSVIKDEIRQHQERLRFLQEQERLITAVEKKEKDEKDAAFVESTLSTVAHHYGVSVSEMIGESKEKRFVQPRKTAQYILFSGTSLSLIKISQIMGRTDHTTAIHSIRTVERRLEYDEEFRERVVELQDEVRRQVATRFYVKGSTKGA